MAAAPQDLASTLLRRAAARRDASEREREACLAEVMRAIPVLRRELGLGRVWLIGTLAWGGFGVRSDVDVVVEHADTDAANALGERLGDLTGRAVDVLVLGALPQTFQARVVAEGLHVP
jgi:predicted nucleotidyltransferase